MDTLSGRILSQISFPTSEKASILKRKNLHPLGAYSKRKEIVHVGSKFYLLEYTSNIEIYLI